MIFIQLVFTVILMLIVVGIPIALAFGLTILVNKYCDFPLIGDITIILIVSGIGFYLMLNSFMPWLVDSIFCK